jgi:putative ABC transport system permease protein
VVWLLGLPARHAGAVSFRLALGGVTASLSRTGVAIAALAMAFAAALGVGAMTSSFRGTVLDWLEHLMQSDVYISFPAGSGGPDDRLPADLLERLAAIPGVTGVSAVRRQFVESTIGQVELVALQPSDPERPAYRFKDSGGGNAWKRFRADEVVLVSEPFANRHRLAPGDFVELTTASDVRAFPVAGIFYDYRSDQGIVLINRALYQRHWRDDGVSSIGVSLAPELSADTLKARLAQASGKDAALQFRSNREIRDASLTVFDRTFAVTRVLRLLAVGVAVAGLIGSLLAMQLERAREFAILRALGMTPGQLMVFVLLQSSVLGLTAGTLALPLGLLMAWVLVDVIQYVSFGWSMELAVPPDALWQTPLLALTAALLAGLYPAWRAGRAAPAAALRDE